MHFELIVVYRGLIDLLKQKVIGCFLCPFEGKRTNRAQRPHELH